MERHRRRISRALSFAIGLMLAWAGPLGLQVAQAVPQRKSVPAQRVSTASTSDSTQASLTNHSVRSGKWPHELAAGNFKIHSDFPLDAKDALLLELRHVQRDLKTVLGVRDFGQKIHVVLFASDSEYRRYMKTYFPGLPSRRAIYLQDRGPGMLFTHWHQDVATDLRHEVTHALLNQSGKTLPLWLDEGIAEYFELPASDRFEANPYLESLRTPSDCQVQSIAQLDAKRTVSEFTDRDYRDSWAWVHYFIHRRAETRAALAAFLSQYASLSDSESTFELERAMRTISPDLEAEMSEHLRQLHARPRMVTSVGP